MKCKDDIEKDFKDYRQSGYPDIKQLKKKWKEKTVRALIEKHYRNNESLWTSDQLKGMLDYLECTRKSGEAFRLVIISGLIGIVSGVVSVVIGFFLGRLQ